jgi:hypothetical protein
MTIFRGARGGQRPKRRCEYVLVSLTVAFLPPSSLGGFSPVSAVLTYTENAVNSSGPLGT